MIATTKHVLKLEDLAERLLACKAKVSESLNDISIQEISSQWQQPKQFTHQNMFTPREKPKNFNK